MAFFPKRLRISSIASSTFSLAALFSWSKNSVSCWGWLFGTSSIALTQTARTLLFHRYLSSKARKAVEAISLGSCVGKGSLHWNCEPKRSLLRICTWTVRAISSCTRKRCPMSWQSWRMTFHTSSLVSRSDTQVMPWPMDFTGETKSRCITLDWSWPLAYDHRARPLTPSKRLRNRGSACATSPMVCIP